MSYQYNYNPTPETDDRFELSLKIDLDEFLGRTADKTKPWKYKLYDVLAQSGDLHVGGCLALIKPD